MNRLLILASPYTTFFDKLAVSAEAFDKKLNTHKLGNKLGNLFNQYSIQSKKALAQLSSDKERNAAAKAANDIKDRIVNTLNNIPNFKTFMKFKAQIKDLSNVSVSNLEKFVDAYDKAGNSLQNLNNNYDTVTKKANNFSKGLRIGLVAAMPLLLKFGARVLYLIPGMYRIGAVSKIANASLGSFSATVFGLLAVFDAIKNNTRGAQTAFNDFIKTIGYFISTLSELFSGAKKGSVNDFFDIGGIGKLVNRIRDGIGLITSSLFELLSAALTIPIAFNMMMSNSAKTVSKGKGLLNTALKLIGIELKKAAIGTFVGLGLSIGDYILRGIVASTSIITAYIFAFFKTLGENIKPIAKLIGKNFVNSLLIGLGLKKPDISKIMSKFFGGNGGSLVDGDKLADKIVDWKSFNKKLQTNLDIVLTDSSTSFSDIADFVAKRIDTSKIIDKLVAPLDKSEKVLKDKEAELLKAYANPLSGFDIDAIFKNIYESIKRGTNNINWKDMLNKMKELGSLYQKFMDEYMKATVSSQDYMIYKVGEDLSQYAKLIESKYITPTQLAILYMKKLQKQSQEASHAMIYGIKDNPLVKELKQVGQMGNKEIDVKHTIDILLKATGMEKAAHQLTDEDYKILGDVILKQLMPLLKNQKSSSSTTVPLFSNNGIGTHTSPVGGGG